MLKKIKLILKSVRQYKKYAIATPFFMAGEAAIECSLPMIISMFNNGIQYGELKTYNDLFKMIILPNGEQVLPLFWLIIMMIVLAVLSLTFGVLGGRFAAKASCGLGANLRDDLYKKIQTFSFGNIDNFHSSSLVTRMTTDVNNVQMSFQMCIRIVVRAPLMFIFSAVMAFATGGQLAWLFIALIPLIILGLFLIVKFAMGIFMRVFKRYDKLNQSVQENVSGIRVVKSYVREDFEKQKFNEASDSMSKDFIKAEKIVALNNPLMNTAIHLSNILILSIGSYLIVKDTVKEVPLNLTIAEMSALISYGISILTSLMIISMIMVMLVMSIQSIRRVAEVLEEEPYITNPENPITEINSGDIIFNNVNFKYKETAEKNTLENINLHIKSGQFIGILGSTGSGKTSLINLISRLYDVSSGSVLVDGHDVRDFDLKTLRDNVAVVLQKNVLFSGTIASNLRWGNKEASEEDMWNAVKIAQAENTVKNKPELFDSVVEQGGSNFSGGQKQRLCIARAILKKPKILILDDSTSAVDTKTDRLIRKALKEDLPAMTKIVIAQRISSIEDADQIIILDDGKIDAIGSHEYLLENNKIYQEVYNTQTRKGGDK